MPEFSLVYSPRAQRDLQKLPPKEANRILDDLEKLRVSQNWEMKTGDFRSLFILRRQTVVLLRVVNRRELEREIKRIDWHWLSEWLKGI